MRRSRRMTRGALCAQRCKVHRGAHQRRVLLASRRHSDGVCYLVTLRRRYLCHRVLSNLLRPRYVSVQPRPPSRRHLGRFSRSLTLSLPVFLSTSTTLRRFDGRKITNVLVLPYLSLTPHSSSHFPVTRTKMQLQGASRQCHMRCCAA